LCLHKLKNNMDETKLEFIRFMNTEKDYRIPSFSIDDITTSQYRYAPFKMQNINITTRGNTRTSPDIVENVLIICMDYSNNEIKNSINQLHPIINTIEIFTNTDECIDFFH